MAQREGLSPAFPSCPPSPRGPASQGSGEVGGGTSPPLGLDPGVSLLCFPYQSSVCSLPGHRPPDLPLPASSLKGPLFWRGFGKDRETHLLSASHTRSDPRSWAGPRSLPRG